MFFMKKRLSEDQYQRAISGLNVSARTLDIAHGVLVKGMSQVQYAKSLGVTKGAVSQAVMRVWRRHLEEADVDEQEERVTAVLPKRQAFIVKQWQEQHRRSQKDKDKK